jgi:hypothetical protein
VQCNIALAIDVFLAYLTTIIVTDWKCIASNDWLEVSNEFGSFGMQQTVT